MKVDVVFDWWEQKPGANPPPRAQQRLSCGDVPVPPKGSIIAVKRNRYTILLQVLNVDYSVDVDLSGPGAFKVYVVCSLA